MPRDLWRTDKRDGKTNNTDYADQCYFYGPSDICDIIITHKQTRQCSVRRSNFPPRETTRFITKYLKSTTNDWFETKGYAFTNTHHQKHLNVPSGLYSSKQGVIFENPFCQKKKTTTWKEKEKKQIVNTSYFREIPLPVLLIKVTI